MLAVFDCNGLVVRDEFQLAFDLGGQVVLQGDARGLLDLPTGDLVLMKIELSLVGLADFHEDVDCGDCSHVFLLFVLFCRLTLDPASIAAPLLSYTLFSRTRELSQTDPILVNGYFLYAGTDSVI